MYFIKIDLKSFLGNITSAKIPRRWLIATAYCFLILAVLKPARRKPFMKIFLTWREKKLKVS
jgi:hypothetical protein